jgi:hypothetical protein
MIKHQNVPNVNLGMNKMITHIVNDRSYTMKQTKELYIREEENFEVENVEDLIKYFKVTQEELDDLLKRLTKGEITKWDDEFDPWDVYSGMDDWITEFMEWKLEEFQFYSFDYIEERGCEYWTVKIYSRDKILEQIGNIFGEDIFTDKIRKELEAIKIARQIGGEKV